MQQCYSYRLILTGYGLQANLENHGSAFVPEITGEKKSPPTLPFLLNHVGMWPQRSIYST
jgi:hypothetical protein